MTLFGGEHKQQRHFSTNSPEVNVKIYLNFIHKNNNKITKLVQ